MLTVAVVLGTRPEAVKLCSVVSILRKNSLDYCVTTIATGQHRDAFDVTATALNLPIDINLGLQRQGQSLGALSAALLQSLDEHFARLKPGLVIVQGDTQTAVMAALAASTRRIPVAHVEAGLRSGNPGSPYPEEANRRIIAIAADIHFAPTARARDNLLAEGIDPDRIVVTGNTVIDSLQKFAPKSRPTTNLKNRRKILVTCHRRESWGDGVERICDALTTISGAMRGLDILFILPLAPDVRASITSRLALVEGITLTEPMPYPDFLARMAESDLVMTDSGGVQEEAPTFGVPTVLLRAECDRPEALDGKRSVMAGTDRDNIVSIALRLLEQGRDSTMACSPYGDGCAAERIAAALSRWRQGFLPLLSTADCFAG
ncbi:non-hydrolyzing UDP-N-acetylglucosamine 2-epimerase [Govanella unica]|uniref:UDP-N-acetylglucosamine 2-epimerase (non-hydrolyzing) n=1 Tax=Govanella unica TaxID=2975056 RepID=A0A9X3TYU7_9PROT|nr:UDP-N-acetylglucosamine 2-epimerase (non-hydrolyzing) [Govania unica]MDA5194291.1 UDP-N-acetylglucosamine 2-epimerase (non-hydrolyzing) [Govania unica]